jgi:hypothetical protein
MSLGLAVFAAMVSVCGTASAEDLDFLPVANISVDVPQQLVGGTANLTASTMFFDVPSSPTAWLKIWDMTTNTLVKQCNANTCTAPVTKFAPTTHAYRAYIADGGSVLKNVVASSSPVSVTWSSTIVLNIDKSFMFQGETGNLTAKASGTAAQSSSIRIIDEQSAQTVGWCTGVTTCVVPVTSPFPTTHTYHAVQNWISSPGNIPILRYSNTSTVKWEKIPA